MMEGQMRKQVGTVWWGMILLFAWSCNQTEPQAIRIAVASSLQAPMQEIAHRWAEDHPELPPLHIISGASGMLRSQMAAGAPFDLFLPANAAYGWSLYEEGLSSAPDTFLQGNCIIWQKAERAHQTVPTIFQQAERIALPNPELAPYGKASRAWLESHGYWEEVASKAVYGTSVSQVNQFIQSGSIDLAFTAPSAEAQITSGTFIEPSYIPEVYHVLVHRLSAPTQRINWLGWVADYIKGEKSRRIFEQYGMQVRVAAPQ
ncbi:MAG: molybdate ABC transporter substrate-binding protein [Bacteroidota bacterium]